MPHTGRPKPGPKTTRPVANGPAGEKRTRTPKSTPTSDPAHSNLPEREVLTLAEASSYLRLPEADVIGATTTQGLPGQLVPGEWRFLKDAIRQWLSSSQPTAEMRQRAILNLAGKWKDDPDIEGMVEDAMRRRGRLPGSDGTYAGCRPAEDENA